MAVFANAMRNSLINFGQAEDVTMSGQAEGEKGQSQH